MTVGSRELREEREAPNLRRRTAVVVLALVTSVGLALGWGRMLEPEIVTLIDDLPGRGAMLEGRAREAGAPSAEIPVRGEMTESDAAVLFPTVRRGVDVFDPLVFFRRPAHFEAKIRPPEAGGDSWRIETNSLGLRQDWELASERPDLRVLVVGDSQTAGVCSYAESFPGVLHRKLGAAHPGKRIEVINGGKGAWTFHNYLGLIDRLRDVELDVVVVVSYAGNDFGEALLLHHYLARTAPPRHDADYHARMRQAVKRTAAGVAYTLQQAHYFADVPEEEELALASACRVTEEILRVCAERGIHPILVSIPTPTAAQPAMYAEQIEEVAAALELTPSELAVGRRLADAWIEFVEAQGHEVVDLLDVLADEVEPMYWERNHHLNPRANERVADRLVPLLERHLNGAAGSETPR